MSRAARSGFPVGWETGPDDDYDYYPLRLPPEITRITASIRLAIQAEFGGWELTRVRLYTDGSRRVLLRRKKSRGELAVGPLTPVVL
ncbi:dihydroorotate dehydrogenase [Mycobacterium sp. CBMA271]|uniref:DUF5703 family protein n=1 Tax=unclassified Mycobacteroides TaxID=2618759 RepID=UPI001328D0C2|nr:MULTISPECIES: DUF5703 family protein [unclassified Mycobacteroides]MUM18681.1 dihydroorotate dehydrogenase [Mycobacteroides sp. CBMA 326]MUM22643.1 dihydroorotate dehydrogenase [Mycobacteroides sp. CBMA 271]